MFIILVWLGVLFIALRVYLRQAYSKFEKHGVKTIKPTPIIGNMGQVMLRKHHMSIDFLELYRAFPDERFVGRYEFSTPMLQIRDLDLVKKIGIKDFESFLNHRTMFEDSESHFSRGLIFLKGQKWKDMRSTLSPAFTSSKIRLMIPFMVEVGDQMMSDLKDKIKASSNGYIDIECKDLASRYAADVIGSCAFGFKVNSFTERTNKFYTTGKETTAVNFDKMMRMFFIANFPRIAKFFNLDLMTSEAKEFFNNLVLGTMKERNLRNILRPDMIHLLMEAKKGKLSHENVQSDDKTTGFASVEESSVGTKKVNQEWTDNDLISQAVLFFIAGFDTVSSAMSFLLYELAINPEVQEKLTKEIIEADIKNDGKFDLKSIQSMTYLDMVVSELLRMWPPAQALDRLCNADYNLGKPNKNATEDFIVQKGMLVSIPVQAIHRDPQYFPNPDKFDPERFSPENQHKINPMAYMPFGVGPRNCIGSRFALSEVKVMTYQILKYLELSPCEKTCIPAELDPAVLNATLKGGHWLRFKIRA